MRKIVLLAGAAAILAAPHATWAADASEAAGADEVGADAGVDAGSKSGSAGGEDIVVTARASTKTDTPAIQVPQPVTAILSETYLSQGAISISDTVRYAAGVTANPYGRDTRVDGFVVRGIDAQQFRDGMRDIFSYYASITADPYNFSRVEIVRGPASVLFGQGSIGGLVNLVSKTPDFETRGELAVVAGSYDRREVMGDVNLALADNLALRAVGRARDADTYVKHVPDDRVMFAPSLRWQPGPDTDITLLGLYQEDDGGSTSQFLPLVGTFRDNPANPARLDRFLFIGKPGWDRYDGRLLQGGGSLLQRFGDDVELSVKARYIDSDLSYFTHYPDSYSNPEFPYLDDAGRTIGLYSEGSFARLNVFSTDNNLLFRFNTGQSIEHKLLAGLDYSWNEVRKRGGYGFDVIDIYDIDYDALTIPALDQFETREAQKQLGLYLQDQIRLWDRVSVVLGARRDRVRTAGTGGSPDVIDKATTYRAGIIGEIAAGFSPFVSYTESFLPLTGTNVDGDPLRPQRGTQYEAGIKWQPDLETIVTVTAFHIKETNRVIYGAGSDITQSGELVTKGFEIEASRTLPGNFEILVNYGYNKLKENESENLAMPRHNASVWSTKTFGLGEGTRLRLGAGVNYTGKRLSGPIVTPGYTLVDALAEISWHDWRFALNATNLLGEKFFASCLARGDCFVGAPRNVMGTVSYRF